MIEIIKCQRLCVRKAVFADCIIEKQLLKITDPVIASLKLMAANLAKAAEPVNLPAVVEASVPEDAGRGFFFEGLVVRTVVKDGEPWFVAKDVAEILGYKNTSKAISDHCRAAVSDGITIRDSIGREQGAVVIPERDIYRLVMKSKLPSAEKFEEWVVSEVLPSIRKTGGY